MLLFCELCGNANVSLKSCELASMMSHNNLQAVGKFPASAVVEAAFHCFWCPTQSCLTLSSVNTR